MPTVATDRASHVGQVEGEGAEKEVLQKRIWTATMAEKETFGRVLLAEEDPLNGMWIGSRIHIRLEAEEP